MNKIQKIEKLNKETNKPTYKKIESQLDFMVKGQEINQQELRLGFIGLAKQKSKLLDCNKKLEQQLELVKKVKVQLS